MVRRANPILLVGALALAAACREGSENSSTDGGFSIDVTSIPPNAEGADGCNGPNQTFGPGPVVPIAVWSSASVAPTSRITAAQGAEELYVTLVDGGLAELEVDGTGAVSETELLPAHFIRDTILAPAGIGADAVVSGLAITTADNVILMEHSGNTIVVARRDPPAFAAAFGTPSAEGGFLDGQLFAARFDFAEPADLCPTSDGRIYVPDSGNNVLRVIESTPEGITVSTVAGTGQTTSTDGDILATAFDTPSGLSAGCFDELIVTERGLFDGGHRLRSVRLGIDPFFGGAAVDSMTLAGDGTALTVEGKGEEASLADPSPAVTTSAGDVYWVDRLTGVLRRYNFATDLADCPLDVDCAAAMASTPFTPGGEFSLAISDAGDLYVLDATAQTLYRIP